jgi:hypothetical protein
MLKFMRKLNVGFATEYVFIYLILIQIAATFIAILSFFIKQMESERIAKSIQSILVYERQYLERYTEIGQDDQTDETFYNSVVAFLEHSKSLVREYGEDVFIYYVMFDQRYISRYSIDFDEIKIEVDKTLLNCKPININGEKIEAGHALVLNDNKLYYLDEQNELQVKENFDIGNLYQSFYDLDNFYNSNFGRSISSDEFLLDYYSFENLAHKKVYFVPKINIEKNMEIEYEGKFDNSNTIYDIFDTIEILSNSKGKRYIIDREKTAEAIDLLLNDYNSKLNYKSQKFYVDFAYGDNFVDFLKTDLGGDSGNYLEKYKKNKKSFFFYGELKKGYVENYAYRVRDARDMDYIDEMYYPFYANSLHLVLNSKIYIPILNIEKDVKFSYDLVLEKLEK